MKEISIYLYLLVAFITIYLVRMLPLVLLTKDIKSRFIRSFLYYVPYVTLSVMTFPAILYISETSIIVGVVGLIVALIIAWFDGNLFKVAIGATLVAIVTQLLINFIM